MLSLAEELGISAIQGLYGRHMQELMQWASIGHEHWTSYSIERAQFEVLVSESGKSSGKNCIHILDYQEVSHICK